MNKKMKLLTVMLLCFIVIVSVFSIWLIEKNKKPPAERNQQKDIEITKSSEAVSQTVTSEEPKENVIKTTSLKYELLSYEIIADTDIEKQISYQAEYFRNGELPDSDYTEEIIDYEAVEKECPELKAMWEESESYTVQEVKDIYQANIDVIQKYTSFKHPKTQYLFVKCKISNRSGRKMDTDLTLYSFVVSADGKNSAYSDNQCYFDKAVNVVGDMRDSRFFWYTFDEDETIECTLGFAIKEEFGANEQFYVGLVPAGADSVDPEHTENIVKVEEIGD